MTTDDGGCCACLNVVYKPIRNEDGSMSERWVCAHSDEHVFVRAALARPEPVPPGTVSGRHVVSSDAIAGELVDGFINDSATPDEMRSRIAGVIEGDRQHVRIILASMGLVARPEPAGDVVEPSADTYKTALGLLYLEDSSILASEAPALARRIAAALRDGAPEAVRRWREVPGRRELLRWMRDVKRFHAFRSRQLAVAADALEALAGEPTTGEQEP